MAGSVFTHPLRTLAFDLGFDHISVTRPAVSTQDQKAYQSWLDAGFSGGMRYLSQATDVRLNPPQFFPTVKSILTIGVSYFQGALPDKPGTGYGRVARYAWGQDYHLAVVKRLEQFFEELKKIIGPDLRAVLAVDSKPVLERAVAAQAGLGFIGKNTVLISPRSPQTHLGFHIGSFLFLAEIFLDREIENPDSPTGDVASVAPAVRSEVSSGCGSCTRCLDACPTDAFIGPYQMDARRCIAYLTIENKEGIDRDLRPKLGDWIFGCDVCQDVCPFNARAAETRWPEFHADHGVGAWISLRDILKIKTNREFQARFGTTPLSRARRNGLLRNAAVAAGNSGDESLTPDLMELLDEQKPFVRSHALWALGRLVEAQRAAQLAERQIKIDNDPEVISECRRLLDPS